MLKFQFNIGTDKHFLAQIEEHMVSPKYDKNVLISIKNTTDYYLLENEKKYLNIEFPGLIYVKEVVKTAA